MKKVRLSILLAELVLGTAMITAFLCGYVEGDLDRPLAMLKVHKTW